MDREAAENGYYYLVDLERSIPTGRLFYWKAGRRGYTDNLADAGIYQEDEALQIALDDLDKRTILIKFTTVKNLLIPIK